jgi:DNA-binding CsgD family transcriptional regulator
VEGDSLTLREVRADGSVGLSNGSILRPREVEVLRLIARGLRNQEIAAGLYLSVHTVEYHAASIFQKLGVRNRTEAGLTAALLGLLDQTTSPQPAAHIVQTTENTTKRPLKPAVIRRGLASRFRLTSHEGSQKVLKGLRSWLSGKVVYTVPRAVLMAGMLVAIFVSTAKVTATFDLDERLIGRRLDTWVLGHPEALHCTSPPAAEASYPDDSRFPPWTDIPQDALVTMEFFGQEVRGLPGTICFKSEADLYTHFGKDVVHRYCVRTDTDPDSLKEVTRIALAERLPVSGAQCFQSVDEISDYFGLDSRELKPFN